MYICPGTKWKRGLCVELLQRQKIRAAGANETLMKATTLNPKLLAIRTFGTSEHEHWSGFKLWGQVLWGLEVFASTCWHQGGMAVAFRSCLFCFFCFASRSDSSANFARTVECSTHDSRIATDRDVELAMKAMSSRLKERMVMMPMLLMMMMMMMMMMVMVMAMVIVMMGMALTKA